MIDSILTNTLLPRISRELLTRLMEGRPVAAVTVTAADSDFQYTFA
jgi:type VI secretion system protein VasG